MTFVPPPQGQSYRDQVFGCSVVRLTDAKRAGAGQFHYYSTLTPISADDSKVFVGGHVTDLAGRPIVSEQNMPQANQGTLLWDAIDGNVFYFARKNSLMKATITGGNLKSSVVHTFSEYKVVVLPDKTDLSIDGQSFAMWAGTTQDVGQLEIFTYNMKSGAKRKPYITKCTQTVAYVQGPCVHGITQTADNNVIIGFANDGSCEECGNRLWNGQGLVHVQDGTNHIDTGYDLDGNSVFIGVGQPSILPGERNACPSGWGLDVRRLSDVHSATCLMDKQPDWHVSYRGSESQPWAALSFFDGRKPGPELFNNNRDFRQPSSSNWKLYEDEIVIARIDGNAVYRLAHARSRSAEGYGAQPKAAISRDGRYVVFDSNMAYAQEGCPAGLQQDCADVYLIRIH